MLKALPQITERGVLKACLELLSYHPKVAFAFRMNSGAMTVGEGAKKRHIRFAFPGASDIMGMLRDGRFLAVECKAPGKKPTADQYAFLDHVHTANGVSLWVDNCNTLKERLDSC